VGLTVFVPTARYMLALKLKALRIAREAMLAEFLDTFYLAPSAERQLACISDEPRLTRDQRLDALAGAIAEYLAKQNRLPKIPDWPFRPCRYLERAYVFFHRRRHARRSYFRKPGRIPLTQGAPAAPGAQRFAIDGRAPPR
jgi:hypothetical protein